jgi:transposase
MRPVMAHLPSTRRVTGKHDARFHTSFNPGYASTASASLSWANGMVRPCSRPFWVNLVPGTTNGRSTPCLQNPREKSPSSASISARIRSHLIGLDDRGTIVLRQKWSRGQVQARLANMPPCLIGMEACLGAHHLSGKLKALGHDARLMPARYMRPYSKGQKNDVTHAEAVAEAVQRPTMKFVATKIAEQLDSQARHRVREGLVSQRRHRQSDSHLHVGAWDYVRQGLRFLRIELPRLLAAPNDVLSPRIVHTIEDLAGDWRRLDERIEKLSGEIETLARHDARCERLMSVPGIGTVISSATVAGDGFSKGRDFAARLTRGRIFVCFLNRRRIRRCPSGGSGRVDEGLLADELVWPIPSSGSRTRAAPRPLGTALAPRHRRWPFARPPRSRDV